VMVQKLNVDPGHRPVKQKRISYAPKRNQAATGEVGKLPQARFIREVYYKKWLANVVMVKKFNWK
jgi:hypothetical protein